MPQQKASARRKRRSPYLFILLAAALLIALALVGMRALNQWNVYETAVALTPTPSPTVRAMTVTPDPNFATHTPTPTAAPSPTPSLLTTGSKGQMVSDMQTRLQELGYYTGKIDGDYGSGTKSAVISFQRQHGLEADGIAGQKTLAMLYSQEAHPLQDTDTLAGDIPILVNKWNLLPDDFAPKDLVTVKSLAGDTLLYDDVSFQGVREAVEALIRMIKDAQADGITPWKLGGAYRTIADQKRIFNNRVEKYLKEHEDATRSQAIANTRLTVADPGASEHHTGLAFDLNVPGEYFVDTAQYLWLKKHCWDYGFIMRYTDDKEKITGIIGEEWHVRYVGVEHAKKIRELDYCLEEYVEYLKNQ